MSSKVIKESYVLNYVCPHCKKAGEVLVLNQNPPVTRECTACGKDLNFLALMAAGFGESLMFRDMGD